MGKAAARRELSCADFGHICFGSFELLGLVSGATLPDLSRRGIAW